MTSSISDLLPCSLPRLEEPVHLQGEGTLRVSGRTHRDLATEEVCADQRGKPRDNQADKSSDITRATNVQGSHKGCQYGGNTGCRRLNAIVNGLFVCYGLAP
jgi:hypothetical protein